MEKNSGMDKDFEMDSPFDDEKVENNPLNRTDLMKLSGKELAKMAQSKSSLMYITLQKKSKAYLCDVILGIEKDEEKPKARATQNTSDSDDIISFLLNTLESIKQNRDNQEARLNPMAKEVFKQSAVSKVDEARASGTLNSDKFNNVLLAVSGTALVIDGLIGFKNVPGVFSKIKNKLKRKKND